MMTAETQKTQGEEGEQVTVRAVGEESIGRQDDLSLEDLEPHVQADAFSIFYHDFEAVKKVSMDVPSGLVTALIGPVAAARARTCGP